jgi:hypothetical protein
MINTVSAGKDHSVYPYTHGKESFDMATVRKKE